MNQKKTWVISILILILIILILVILVYTFNKKETLNNNQISEKTGKYFDEDGNLLGTCTSEKNKETFITLTKFYDINGNLLGSCSLYSGPGGSGWKGGCDEDSVKNNIGNKIQEGVYAGRISQKYECKTE